MIHARLCCGARLMVASKNANVWLLTYLYHRRLPFRSHPGVNSWPQWQQERMNRDILIYDLQENVVFTDLELSHSYKTHVMIKWQGTLK